MSLTNQELFEKGEPISKLFPIRAENGIIIEQQNFYCEACETQVPLINTRGFLIDRDDTLVSHVFCQCPNCYHMTVRSDAYEELMFGIALWKKDGSQWVHTQNVDIPKRYWPKILWVKLKARLNRLVAPVQRRAE